MKRFTCTYGRSLTSPTSSQMVMPVTMAKRNTMAKGLRKLTTMVATKNTLVMLLTIKFFIF